MKRSYYIWLLRPFSVIYGLITDVRNWLFDSHLLFGYRPGIFTVSVGNLTVGGTGKTPMIEFLIKRFLISHGTDTVGTVTLSRGYGRQTKGFRMAIRTDTAETIGDEPLQLYRKFGDSIRVFVGERRADAIRTIQRLHPETKRILLDDAFQHRAVKPHLNILLMDFTRPFYTDYPFPAGRLRERRHGARRANAVVVTKCPDGLSMSDQQVVAEKISRYTQPGTPLFFAGLAYDQPMTFATHKPADGLADVVLVTGLANADPLERYVEKTFTLQHHHRFADHYRYSRADLDRLLTGLSPGTSLLTTEKDWVKLDALLTPAERSTLPLFYLPVRVAFLGKDELAFGQFLDKVCQ